jgi:hypothetical protein
MRNIPPGRRTITGKLPSRYPGELLQYESGLERNFLIVLEAEPGTEMVKTQVRPLNAVLHDRRP